jgi:SAM-dependent methyltransferase
MSKLTQKTHWDSVHLHEREHFFPSQVAPDATLEVPLRAKAVGTVKRLLGKTMLERMTAYDDYLLWKVILPKYVPQMPGGKVVEIGSAPGDYVVAFAKHHGCIPHGIEYSEVGVELNRRVFSMHGFDPDNVIQSDFFSDEFRNRYREQFDAVISKGFIEHFADLRPVIDGHMDLLKPGGYLVVTIPNLRGLNYPVIRLLDGEAIPRHNIEIMRKKIYATLFDRTELEPLFCDYYGTFSLYLYTAGRSKLQRSALRTGYKLQPFLNLGFRTVLGSRGLESGLLSPFLLYIGKKRE